MISTTPTNIAISDRLSQLAADAQGQVITLDWLLTQLHQRAFGLVLVTLALPCCIPFLYGLPQIVALPLIFVSFQILIGRDAPWLPAKLGARTIAADGLSTLARRAAPWLRRIETLSRPRLAVLTYGIPQQLVGAALILFSASILLPLPGTNTVPAFSVVLIAMGLLQRDGVLVLVGSVMGTLWIATLIFAGATVLSIFRSWIEV